MELVPDPDEGASSIVSLSIVDHSRLTSWHVMMEIQAQRRGIKFQESVYDTRMM